MGQEEKRTVINEPTINVARTPGTCERRFPTAVQLLNTGVTFD